MKKRSLLICVFVTAMAAVLSGCGKNFYYAGRSLPPSGLTNRVLIGVQNPSALTTGTLEFVDGYYDIRHNYNNTVASFSISGYSGKPLTIQNMPEEQLGAVYNTNDGSFSIIDYANEKLSSSITASGSSASLAGLSSSVFTTRSQTYVVAANEATHYLTVIDRSAGTAYYLNLPGVYRVSVNPGGTVMLAFKRNNNEAYYVRRLQTGETAPITVDPSNPSASDGDCEPQNNPIFCVLPVTDKNGTVINFNYPSKALFSSDGSSAYVLNCGAECGSGSTASVQILPTGPFLIPSGQKTTNTISLTPCATTTNCTALPSPIPVPGGASNGVLSGSTLYLAGQSQTVIGSKSKSDTLWTGNLTVLNTSTNTISGTYSISDGSPGKMILADDNSLWIGATGCSSGERQSSGLVYGCLTMFNTSTNAVIVDSYKGDLTGIAALTGLNKVYVAEGGQIHIYKTAASSGALVELDNSQVTVTGTAYDVSYMDGTSDTNNTTY